MKKIITLLITFLLTTAALADSNAFTQSQLNKTTTTSALSLLKQGNQEYVTGSEIVPLKAQHPFAVILSCMDSRSDPAVLFHQALGNMFVIRLAGNVVDRNVLGSMEYATKVVGSKIIVVMGHTDCGAVIGACKYVRLGNLSGLLRKIQSAVHFVKHKEGRRFSCDKTKSIDAVTKQNVLNQIASIKRESPIINTLVKKHKVIIVGAMHDLNTGKVTFF